MRSFETAEALGRSLIVQKDASRSEKSQATASKFVPADPEWYICQDKTVRVSFNLIPKEALDYIRYKALTISGVESGQLTLEVRNRLIDAIRNGLTYDEFKAKVNEIFDSYGVTELGSNHLQTVFRTNLFTAYSAGELNQVQNMVDRFPLWEYSAIKDSRTRPTHRALDGNIYRVGEGPVPPIDYNCRCTAVYLHVTDVESGNLWSKVQDWQGGDVQRFDTRAAFEKWKRSQGQALTSDVLRWIQQNLGQSGSEL